MTTEENSLVVVNQELTTPEFKKLHTNLASFVKKQLRQANNIAGGDSGDYGIIPYTKKMSLLKPGAEKLLKLFGFAADNQLVDRVEDWEKRFVMYRYKCVITHIASGKIIASATRTCNSKEKKHAGKDVYDVANTIESVAQKRALVAATVQATMASEIFDADVSEHDDEAPHKPITADEDPHRMRVFGDYFQSAADRGFTQDQAKKTAYRKLNVTSLKDVTTQQVEGLIVELEKTFRFVGKGNKPERMVPEKENQVVDGTIVFHCYNEKKHGPILEKRPLVKHLQNEIYQNPTFCTKECEDEWLGPKKDPNNRDWSKLGKAGYTTEPI